MASNNSGFVPYISSEADLTFLGSCLPIAGTDVARNSWNGLGTKRPVSSNHEANGVEMSRDCGSPDLGSEMTVT
jgi:hypothetical protein